MSNSSQSNCWFRCFWCITSCGGKRVPRVSPSDPIPVVNGKDNAAIKEDILQSKKAKFSESVAVPPGGNGKVNHFYISDETDDSDYTNSCGSNTINNENCDCNSSGGTNNHQIISHEITDLHLQNSVFIEVGKERRLRVVHLQAIDTSTTNSSNNVQKSPSVDDETDSPEKTASSPVAAEVGVKKAEDEEEEYWFSKWTRKPRFRSIFEKNTIHGGSEDDSTENNNTVANGSGEISKDFELARAAAAAKRRAWAYNNATCDPVVEHSTIVENNDEEEFNSIDICDSNVQRWSKNNFANENESPASTSDSQNSQSSSSKVQNSAGKSEQQSEGITNLGFEEDDDNDSEAAELKITQLQLRLTTSSDSNNHHPLNSENNQSQQDKIEVVSEVPEEPVQNLNLNPSKPPILFFIHGISTSSDVWKTQMDYFHNLGFEIVAPDLLGHGFSSTSYNVKYYLFESLAQDLLSVFDHFVEEGRKVVIIGHGYGACLASVITRVRPKSASLLISIAGGGPTPLVSRTCCRSSLIPFYCKLFHTNKKKGRFDNSELKNILPPAVHNHFLAGQIWSDGDSAFYRRISVPTLLVYGMKDKIVNLVEECEMERTIPKSFLEIIDTAGHMVMSEEPAKLNKMLGKFIQSWV